MPIKTFRDLRVWKSSHRLAVSVYESTDAFPKKEIYGLVSQIRRSAHSVSSNIAEGFGRWSAKEKVHYLYMARGSATETQCHLLLAADLRYIGNDAARILYDEYEGLIAGINAMINNSHQSDLRVSASPRLRNFNNV